MKAVVAFVLSAVVFLFVAVLNTSAFPFEVKKEYYLSSASSQAVIVNDLSIFELPFVRGESIRIDCTGESVQERETLVQDLLAKYKANVLKIEIYADGASYYCYSAKLKQGISLDGKTVNLHVVVKNGEVILGTPIIFGGY